MIPYYEFVTRWQFQAKAEDLYEVLSEPLEYPRWMKHLQIQVSSVAKGDASGVGREDHYELRGFLPYTLRWNLKCVQAEKPRAFTSTASGDFEGTGRWSFEPQDDFVVVTFDWRVKTHQPFLRYFSGFLRPFFEWNHDWVMKRWEKDLRIEIERKGERKSISR